MNKRLFNGIAASICVLLSIIFIAGCRDPEQPANSTEKDIDNNGEYLLSENDLTDLDLYIHGNGCGEADEFIPVKDEDMRDKLMSCCLSVEKFRPVTVADNVNEDGKDDYFMFQNGDDRYIFTLYKASEQYDEGFIYRDIPLIVVTKATLGENNQYELDWEWFCKINAVQYQMLFSTAVTYSADEIITLDLRSDVSLTSNNMEVAGK